MTLLEYESCLVDPDIWLRKAVTLKGEEYYEYVLLYVDDVVVVSEHPKKCLLKIEKYFPMIPGSIGVPKICLGGKISQVQLPNDIVPCITSMSQYV